MYLISGGCAWRSSPFATLPITSAPSSADQTRAAPSEEACAADHGGSDRLEQERPAPVWVLAAVSRETNMSPPTAAIRPERAKTMIRIREILTPARRDASAFPPIAKT